ncbi:MAG TPA: gamma-glutamyltransferase family protein [Micropepsaceae bacterium]|nr:gamma-glutamyltransferase family protein [Micropepsaceae bacterium]
MTEIARYCSAALLSVVLFSPLASAQQLPPLPPLSTCNSEPKAAFCNAVRGDRTEGWLAQSRAEVMASHGMVATSQPLAAQAGLRMLMQGGNAVDAAVASAAVLSIVEPMNVGIGGDLFAILYIAKEHKIYALNASGMAPTGANLERFNSLGYKWNPNNWAPGSGMPGHGILTVTVPGTVWGWDAVLKRFGKKTFKEDLEPAVDYAENGFPVSERIAYDWQLPPALPLRNCCSDLDPDSVKTWYVNGKQPVAGQIYRNPDLAKTFRLIQQHGANGFYKGEVARALVAKSNALGGTMTLDDLANYKGEWGEPASSTYHGYTLLELPPPSQDWAANEMLNVLEACVPKWAPGQTLATLGPRSAKYWHFLVEAKKLAYADLFTYNADPDFSPVPLNRLLSKPYAASLCGKVDPARASSTGPMVVADKGLGDTIVLSAADAEGNMVSWVNSNYSGFGSGITVPGYGFILHNRGALFTLNPKSPNAIAPHKRPFNTLSAGFVMRGPAPMMAFQLMGGDMQAQGHAQVLVNMLDLGANLQAATDMARFHHSQVGNELGLEAQLYNLVGKDLTAMGHRVRPIGSGAVGGYQAILVSPGPDPANPANGRFYRAGSDHRKDGQAVGW